MVMNEQTVISGEAWEEFCRRIMRLGHHIVDDESLRTDFDRAEGFRHLANQVACWLTYAVGQSNPAVPQFLRTNSLTYRWGGPNVDNNTRRAVIDGRGTYRVSGNMHGCRDFILQVKSGEMHTNSATTPAEVRAAALGIAPGDSFEILISPNPQSGHWVKTEETDTAVVHIRDFYFEWDPVEPAAFVIERLDTLGVVGPAVTAADVAWMFDEALRQIEGSMGYWPSYLNERRQGRPPNTFSDPNKASAGVQDVLYTNAFVRLGRGRAAVFTFPADASRYWDIQLYNLVWFEPLDYVTRTTSLTHVTAVPNVDGNVRIVVAADDPGVANWLDTEGRDEVMASIRFFGAEQSPTINSVEVALSDLASHLPADTTNVTAADRALERERRQRHVAWRYRD
jgi:hypothetical protein